MVSKTGDSEENPVIFIRAYDDGSYYVSSSVEFVFGGYEANLLVLSQTEGNDGNTVYYFSVDGTDKEFYATENANAGGYIVTYDGENTFYGFLSSEHFLVYEEPESSDETEDVVETAIEETDTSDVEEELKAQATTEPTTEATKVETTEAATKAETKSDTKAANNSSAANNNGSNSGSTKNTTTAANSSSSNKSSSNSTSNSNSSSSSSSTSSSSTSSSNSSSSGSTHVHSYTIPVYKTVHHDAVTGTRTVETPVYKEVPVMRTVDCEICNKCSTLMYTQTDVTNHAKETGHSNYRGYQYQEESGEYQTVIWDYETSTETYTVTEAYDEKVIDHYECSCGATK